MPAIEREYKATTKSSLKYQRGIANTLNVKNNLVRGFLLWWFYISNLESYT